MKRNIVKKAAIINRVNNDHGMTLIEIIIFTVLLSLLITNTINYLYMIHINNIELIHDIQNVQNS